MLEFFSSVHSYSNLISLKDPIILKPICIFNHLVKLLSIKKAEEEQLESFQEESSEGKNTLEGFTVSIVLVMIYCNMLKTKRTLKHCSDVIF